MIRPKLLMSKMGGKKKEAPISDETFEIRKLDLIRRYYDSLEPFRTKSERTAKYFNGDQWHDLVQDADGEWVREDDYIMSQGKTPLKQNLIKSTIRSLLGQYRSDTSKSVVVARTPEKAKESEMLSNALQYSLASVNKSKDLDARLLEELLLSGLPIQKILWKYIPELKRKEVVLKNVNRNAIIFNPDIEDIRLMDLRMIGEIMDYTMDELIVDFGTTPQRAKKLKEIYSGYDEILNTTTYDEERYYNKSFYVPNDLSKCRVILSWELRLVQIMEVHDWMDGRKFYAEWTQSDLAAANQKRVYEYSLQGIPEEEVPPLEGEIENNQKWWYTYYSPWGHVLREGETPFDHGSHPYVMTPYPLLDGNITGLGSDLIDAQRQVNRLLILQDMILSSSVKNTLVIDKNSMNGQSKEQIGEDYKTIGGVVVLDLQKGAAAPPIELRGSIGNLGISEMIQIYIKMLQDVSGVNPAMQGQTAQSGTSGRLYDAQITQSTLNSKDIMDTFTGLFRQSRDMKLLKTIQQFYDTPRMIAIAGKSYTETAQLYDPELVKDIDFDLTIGQANDSPVYRTIIDETLNQFVMKGLIDLEMFLENTTLPFSNQMLESLKRRKEQAVTDPYGAAAGIGADAQAAGVQGDPNVINAVSQGIKG